MGRALANQPRTIRLPARVGEKLGKVGRARAGLSQVLGREPTDEELVEELGWTIGELRSILRAPPEAASLDAAVSAGDGDSLLGNLVEDESSGDPADVVVRQMESARVGEAVGELPDRVRRVLVRRYGLDDEEPATLAELGRELGVTRDGCASCKKRRRAGSGEGAALVGLLGSRDGRPELWWFPSTWGDERIGRDPARSCSGAKAGISTAEPEVFPKNTANWRSGHHQGPSRAAC